MIIRLVMISNESASFIKHHRAFNLMVRVMVINATFDNISVISWRTVLLMEETGVPQKTTDLSQVTGKLHLTMSRIRNDSINGDRHRLHW